jgi:4,5-dihydroxyphthalate decarboxylase
MGAEFWPYGIEADRDIIDTQIRRSRQQGLIPRRLAIEEPFAPA